jgi:hypothetical protein
VREDTHSRKGKEVSARLGEELRGFAGDFPHPTRAELPAALPAPSDSFPSNCDVLGEPLGIHEVAEIIGCSPWTVRQKYIPAGLPHLRSGPSGKLLFYKNQVIRWLLRQQEKGGSRT